MQNNAEILNLLTLQIEAIFERKFCEFKKLNLKIQNINKIYLIDELNKKGTNILYVNQSKIFKKIQKGKYFRLEI